MQQPTCSGIRIRSTRDAHIIFHAVSQKLLPMITRRLDADERNSLRSGCVYAWEERGPQTEVTGLGIERFTEGRRWGPSRVRDEFLFYYEKSPPGDQKEKENPDTDTTSSYKQWDPLVKQTYSVWVDSPRGRRKWHLTAYFTQATVDQLKTIDDYSHLRGLEVPTGKYQSTRMGKTRRGEEPRLNLQHDVFRPTNASATRTYAPFPLPYSEPPPPPQYGSPVAVPYPIATGAGYQTRNVHHDSSPQYTPATSQTGLTLPPIRAPPSPQSRPPIDPATHNNQSQAYPPQTTPNFSQPGVRHSHVASAPDHASGYVLRPAYYPPPPPPPHHMYAASQTDANGPQPTAYPRRPFEPHEPAYAKAQEPRYPPTPPINPNIYSQDPQSQSSVVTYPSQVPFLRRDDSPNYVHSSASSQRTRTPSTSPRTAYNAESGPTVAPPPHPHPTLSAPLSDVRDEGVTASPKPAHSANGTSRVVGLAPLRALQRPHPYRRDEFDDQALKAFCPDR